MDNLDIYLLILSAIIALKFTREIFTIAPHNKNAEEARIFFNEMSENKGNSKDGRDRSYGLTLAKYKKDEKYRLIPQSKLVGLELA